MFLLPLLKSFNVFGLKDLNEDALQGRPKLVVVWTEEYENGPETPNQAYLKQISYYQQPFSDPTEQLSYRPDGTLSYRQTSTFVDGRIHLCVVSESTGTKLQTKRFIHSSEGHLQEIIDEDADGRELERTVFTVDESGRNIKVLTLDQSGAIKAELTYVYDSERAIAPD
ncbi:MAG: hypothetical protein WA324_21475 [Bryobacteraceae bacterium]